MHAFAGGLSLNDDLVSALSVQVTKGRLRWTSLKHNASWEVLIAVKTLLRLFCWNLRKVERRAKHKMLLNACIAYVHNNKCFLSRILITMQRFMSKLSGTTFQANYYHWKICSRKKPHPPAGRQHILFPGRGYLLSFHFLGGTVIFAPTLSRAGDKNIWKLWWS